MMMSQAKGFTLLECLVATSVAAALLTAIFPLYSTMRAAAVRQMQLGQTLNKSELLLALLTNVIRTAKNNDCATYFGAPSLLVGSYEKLLPSLHDVVAGSDILLIDGCASYNSTQHWLRRVFYLSKDSASNQPGYSLYQKILAVDGLPVSIAKQVLLSGVYKLNFKSCRRLLGQWSCLGDNSKSLSQVIQISCDVISSIKFVAKTQPMKTMPWYVDQQGLWHLRWITAVRHE